MKPSRSLFAAGLLLLAGLAMPLQADFSPQDLDVKRRFSLSGDITPAELTAATHNYNPTGLNTAAVLRLSADAERTLTGIAYQGDGRLLLLQNVGSFAITLADESGSSTEANRFALTADFALAPDAAVLLQYDATADRWRLIGGAAGGGGGEGDVTAAGDNVFTGDNEFQRTSLLTPVDLDTATELAVDRLNTNAIAANKTYTFASGLVIYRPFYLDAKNTDDEAITITLTAPGGYTLHSVERNATLTSFSLGAGQTYFLTFVPVSASVINVYGVPPPLNWIEEIQLTHPHQVDGTGATMNTTSSAATYGHATFSNSADQAANFVIYRFAVPHDFDSAVDLQAEFVFRLGGADTGTHRYVISMASVADSASADSPTFSNAINLDFAGDASGASGDRAKVAWTTLTSWRSSITAGHTLVVKLARDGDATEDGSSVSSTDQNLKLKIGHTQ